MSISEPQSLTLSGTAVTLNRVQSNTGGLYQTTNGMVSMSFRSDESSSDVNRRSVVVRMKEIVADELVPSTNKLITTTITLSIQSPKSGLTQALILDRVVAVLTQLRASSDEDLIKMIAGEV